MSGTPGAPLIELNAVSKSFALPDGSRLNAVRGVSLQVQAGEVFGLVGRSGAGKSTLLRLINLLEQPDAGRVAVGEQVLTELPKKALRQARQTIGMIFQQFNLLQNASVTDNVAFSLRIHGAHGRHDRAAIDARVRECLALVGLTDKAHAYPAQLSGGQKQRVAIARALASHPQVLLCDEPTSALDAQTTDELIATLRDINTRLGVTIVIVTHELPVVAALCRRAAVIEDGRLAELLDVQHITSPRTRIGQELARLVQPAADARELSRA